eukprot:UN21951
MPWQVSGYYFSNVAHRGASSRKGIQFHRNAYRSLKTNKSRREAPRRNVMESKHTESGRPKGCGLALGFCHDVIYGRSLMKSYPLTYFKVLFVCHISVLRPFYIDLKDMIHIKIRVA